MCSFLQDKVYIKWLLFQKLYFSIFNQKMKKWKVLNSSNFFAFNFYCNTMLQKQVKEIWKDNY